MKVVPTKSFFHQEFHGDNNFGTTIQNRGLMKKKIFKTNPPWGGAFNTPGGRLPDENGSKYDQI